MDKIRTAAVNVVFGAAASIGLEHGGEQNLQAQVTADLTHELTAPAEPHPVRFYLNREMRRALDTTEDCLIAPEGLLAKYNETAVNGAIQAIAARNQSTHRTQF